MGTADTYTDLEPSGTVTITLTTDGEPSPVSLTTMSANWSGFTDATSGVVSYEYSVGTTADATDIKSWTGVGPFLNATDSGLVLNTGQTYFFNVRATDVAGNTMTSSVSSDGQAVEPTLTVTLSDTQISLGSFDTSNDLTQVKTITVTVSTNAYNGFDIKMFETDYLRSEITPAIIIADFSAGTYASPAEWGTGDAGWGFNTDDCDLNSGAFWTGPSCTGNAKYAPITQTEPGNVVGAHTALVTGATGPVASEQFVITLRATTTVSQEIATYSTGLVFGVVPKY